MLTTLLDDTQARKDGRMCCAIDQLFFRSRSVIITGEINDKVAARDTARDLWLTTRKALDGGLVGQVIPSVDNLR